MKTYVKWVWFTILISLVAFILSPSLDRLITSPTFQGKRVAVMYLTGSLAIILMSAAVIVSARLSFVNKLLGGLDKAYNYHKFTAGLGFLFGLIHYIISFSNKLLIKAGILEGGSSTLHLEGLIRTLYKASFVFLEAAFGLMIVVFFVAAYRKFPYKIFQLSHKLIPVLYLFVAFHAGTTIFRGGWVGHIGGIILHAFVIVGSICAFISIFQLVAINRKYKGTIKSVHKITENVIELQVETAKPFSFKAGQFAFLNFKFAYEPHPFTIATYNNDNLLKFYIKESGDWTNKLFDNIKEGDTVKVEGPYGGFTFNDDKFNNQLWIAGGIGITPFIAELEYLSSNKSDKNITFIFSHEGKSPLEDRVKELCDKIGVKLTIVDTSKDGYLTYNKIKEISGDIENSSIWFCGPYPFRRGVEKGLRVDNININNLHYDSFTFR